MIPKRIISSILANQSSGEKAFLNAKLSDFRIYRIPLTPRQIARIYFTALRGGNPQAGRRGQPEQTLPVFPATTPQLYNAFLLSVPDTQVETTAGHLPRLPRFVKGVYSNGIGGSRCESDLAGPEDNSQVLVPGTYTVTGKVSGTSLQPKAVVTVRAADGACCTAPHPGSLQA
jgi:uncharacterized protein